MTIEESFYTAVGLINENTQQSKMFGKPCFKINSKAYICFFQNEMVFKLSGEVHKEALNLNGAQLFDPSGKKRPMKEWVQVPFKHKNKWAEFAEAAMNYVSEK